MKQHLEDAFMNLSGIHPDDHQAELRLRAGHLINLQQKLHVLDAVNEVSNDPIRSTKLKEDVTNFLREKNGVLDRILGAILANPVAVDGLSNLLDRIIERLLNREIQMEPIEPSEPVAPPKPSEPALIYPTKVEIDLGNVNASIEGKQIPIAISDEGDHFLMRRTDGTESFTGRTKIALLGMDYGFNLEDAGAPYLRNTQVWTIRVVGQPNRFDSIGPTGGAVIDGGPIKKTENGVGNWPQQEYERTGGTSVNLNLPEMHEKGVITEIVLEGPVKLGEVRRISKPLRLPPRR